jgi:hypothetical protein
MLRISRLVPLGQGHSDLQDMERYREIDFPVAGPSQATDQQKAILAEALQAVSLEDHDSSSGGQMVLISPSGRILAFENARQLGTPSSFTWGDRRLVVLPAGPAELPTFMCEQRVSCDGHMNPNCFEITDSLGRSWIAYEVNPGLADWSKFPETDGIQICPREDLANRLGQA